MHYYVVLNNHLIFTHEISLQWYGTLQISDEVCLCLVLFNITIQVEILTVISIWRYGKSLITIVKLLTIH